MNEFPSDKFGADHENDLGERTFIDLISPSFINPSIE